MQSEQQNLKFQIITPTNQPPSSLSSISKNPEVQFILGYRNILVPGENGWSWGLVKNDKFCGRAFIFEISQQEAQTIQQVKKPGQLIETVGNSYILIKNQKELQNSTEEISLEQLNKLFKEIGGFDKVNLNILKNAFNGLSQYQLMTGKAISQLNFQDNKEEIAVADQVKLQFNAKSLAGSSLLDLPEISKETGVPIEGKKLTIKAVYS